MLQMFYTASTESVVTAILYCIVCWFAMPLKHRKKKCQEDNHNCQYSKLLAIALPSMEGIYVVRLLKKADNVICHYTLLLLYWTLFLLPTPFDQKQV